MIRRIQSGQNLNTVIALFDKILIKGYVDKLALKREVRGISYWKKQEMDVPLPFFKINNIAFYSFINQKEGSEITEEKLVEFLSTLYTRMYFNSYLSTKSSKDYYDSWKSYLQYIENSFREIEKDAALIKSNLLEKIDQMLNQILGYDWDMFRMSPLHRDIHKGNILYDYKKEKIFIIDFEHFCMGPIEYEFSNSLFWRDKMSLPVEDITEKLEENNVPFNRYLMNQLISLYFIDQCFIAFKNKDMEKIELLINKMKEVTKNNTYFN